MADTVKFRSRKTKIRDAETREVRAGSISEAHYEASPAWERVGPKPAE